MALFDFLKKKELNEISELKKLLSKYQPIIDIESEIQRNNNELEKVKNDYNSKIKELEKDLSKINLDYKQSLEVFTRLRKEISVYESKLDLIEFGVYEPVYDFEKSDDYRNEQNKIIEKQKAMISDERAAICRTNWTIDGSEAKGKASTKKYIKLTLRAFNGECDSLIAKVKWNNVNQMKERMRKSFETINKLGESQTVSIQEGYYDLKYKELILEHEYQQKKQAEKEELRKIQEELREEEKVRREIEQAQKEAEKDETNYQKALDKARKEVEISSGEKHEKLLEQIKKLELELKEAQEKKERALSMAQQTKRGHVYVISNIGSFGEHVYKIGMTRRLEPLDRIKELGDASVPFSFDVHALIFSEDAPALENELHKVFEKKSVNLVNFRKEFFKVTLDDIERVIKENGINAELIHIPEAEEYRETLAILERMNNPVQVETVEERIKSEFPESLI